MKPSGSSVCARQTIRGWMIFVFFGLARPTKSETKLFKDDPKSARCGNEAEADGVANGTKWKPNEKISDLAKVTPIRIWTNWPRIWSKWVLEGQTGTRRTVRTVGPIHKESPTSLFGTLPNTYVPVVILK